MSPREKREGGKETASTSGEEEGEVRQGDGWGWAGIPRIWQHRAWSSCSPWVCESWSQAATHSTCLPLKSMEAGL